jgi:Ca2+/H+ antiporter
MRLFEFFSWNVIAIGVISLIVVLYLIGLINKRRRHKFLHDQSKEPSDSESQE